MAHADRHATGGDRARAFLFLQGPSSPFFARIARALRARGHPAYRINLCVGDRLFWHAGGSFDYRGRLNDWEGYIERFLDEHAITDVLLLGEQRAHHKIAIARAQARGIRVHVTDFGYLRPDWIILERDGISAASHFPRDPARILELAARSPRCDRQPRYQDSFWRMALAEMAYHLSGYFLWWLYPHYRSFKVENPVAAYLGTGLRLLMARRHARQVAAVLQRLRADASPYFLFPLQMENDFQIRAYSPYPDMTTPIAEVIDSFARHAPHEAHLLIKVHPWDPGLKNWARIVRRHATDAGVATRVHTLDGGSLYALAQHARGMVTINSTSGLQALLLDCPLITLGAAVFNVPGLTHQHGVDTFWRDATPPDTRLRDAFIDALAATTMVRGVFYRQPGLDAAVDAVVERLLAERP